MAKAISDQALDELVKAKLGSWLEWPLAGWDLDSTLCDTLHRAPMVERIRSGRELVTWDDYSMLCSDDLPIEGSVALLREMAYGPGALPGIAISGRSMCAEDLTWEWLKKHKVLLRAVILRPDGDHTPNGVWKSRVILSIKRLGGNVRLFFEDWDKAAEVIRKETGVPVVGINPFYPPRNDPRNENSSVLCPGCLEPARSRARSTTCPTAPIAARQPPASSRGRWRGLCAGRCSLPASAGTAPSAITPSRLETRSGRTGTGTGCVRSAALTARSQTRDIHQYSQASPP